MEKDTDKALQDGLQASRERAQNLAGYFSPANLKSRVLGQAERLSYNVTQGAKAFAVWGRPGVVEEKASMFKAPEARKKVVVEAALITQAGERSKELPTLKVGPVLRLAAKQEDKRVLLKKEPKYNLLPKKVQQKPKSLSVR